MSDTQNQTPDPAPVEGPNFLEMSDEDILNMESPQAAAAAPEEASDPAPEAEAAPVAAAPAEDPAEEDGAAAGTERSEGAPAQAAADDGKEAAPEAAPAAKAEEVKDSAAEAAAETKPEDASGAIDYKAVYDKLFAPFKANGRDIKVNSVEDAISLMQMGANYNKKMAALKPNLRLMKMLENNGLLSEEKLSFLIDLDKKNPAAISKLVKDSGVDPMDLGADQASAYKQSTYTVDDREVELDAVLDEIQGTPTYSKTLDVVSNKWDGPSKQIIASTPAVLKVINDHMQSGIYDIIAAEVENERLFGRLNGLSDIEAYRKVGDAIQARGGFNHLGAATAAAPAAPAAAAPVAVVPAPAPAVDDKLKDKRRAASGTQAAAPATKPVMEFNPLALSDEEISKMAAPKYS